MRESSYSGDERWKVLMPRIARPKESLESELKESIIKVSFIKGEGYKPKFADSGGGPEEAK